MCEKHLAMNRHFRDQTPEALTQYFRAVSILNESLIPASTCTQASDQYPILNGYQDLWLARDFARMYLKNKVGQDKAKARTGRSR